MVVSSPKTHVLNPQSRKLSVGIVFGAGIVGVASIQHDSPSNNDSSDALSSKPPDFRWLDVTTSNFEETLPIFEHYLKKSVFVSFDTEFSGLTKPGGEDPTYNDSPADYYAKKAASTREFIPLQVGICLFVKPQDVLPDLDIPIQALQTKNLVDGQVLVALPYNFYVFPRPYTHNATKLPDEKSGGAWRRNGDPALRHDPSFLAQSGSIEFLSQHGYDFNKTFKEGIPFLTADQEAKFKEIGFGNPVVADQNEVAFNRALGFRRAMKLMFFGNDKSLFQVATQSPPIVGHNMLLDLMHVYHRFESDLPADLCTFKKEINKVLPVIIDTKNIAYMDENLKPVFGRSTALDPVFTKSVDLSPTPAIVIPSNFGNQDSSSALLHQAAYDAFITGFAFARMSTFLHQRRQEDPNLTSDDKADDASEHPIIAGSKKYQNQLHMMFNKHRVMYLTSKPRPAKQG